MCNRNTKKLKQIKDKQTEQKKTEKITIIMQIL